jgi:ABC-type lipoprotein export system ATPase subunit
MDQPTSGRMLFKDRDLSRASETSMTLYRRYEVALSFSFITLFPI